ncbi:MAG: hypothetical protein K2Y05_05550, partial [Hyphomicrobiaceae bacterium]|nr:hypothetical protein [Hyphomicrobiaceae bacterium]
MTLDAAIAIRRLVDLPDQIAAERAMDNIFFAAAGTKDFASPEHRAEFRERWLGRYLDSDPDEHSSRSRPLAPSSATSP